jgi:hypothetical protein
MRNSQGPDAEFTGTRCGIHRDQMRNSQGPDAEFTGTRLTLSDLSHSSQGPDHPATDGTRRGRHSRTRRSRLEGEDIDTAAKYLVEEGDRDE